MKAAYFPYSNFVLDQMKINLDMFGALMLHRIR
jgi:hypothetical protein